MPIDRPGCEDRPMGDSIRCRALAQSFKAVAAQRGPRCSHLGEEGTRHTNHLQRRTKRWDVFSFSSFYSQSNQGPMEGGSGNRE